MELHELRHEHFAERIGDTFTTVADDVTVSLELVAATVPPGDRPDNAHFVEFRGPLDLPLGQGIHELAHDGLGSLPLFLVPVAETADGFVYEAVFTRVDD